MAAVIPCRSMMSLLKHGGRRCDVRWIASSRKSSCLYISAVFWLADEHNSLDFPPLTYSRLLRTPLLTTIECILVTH